MPNAINDEQNDKFRSIYLATLLQTQWPSPAPRGAFGAVPPKLLLVTSLARVVPRKKVAGPVPAHCAPTKYCLCPRKRNISFQEEKHE